MPSVNCGVPFFSHTHTGVKEEGVEGVKRWERERVRDRVCARVRGRERETREGGRGARAHKTPIIYP